MRAARLAQRRRTRSATWFQSKLDELEERMTAVEAEVSPPRSRALRVYPNLVDIYRRKVANFQVGRTDLMTRPEALEILRGLMERIAVWRADDSFVIEIMGEITNMVKLLVGAETIAKESRRRSVKVVVRAPLHSQFALPPLVI